MKSTWVSKLILNFSQQWVNILPLALVLIVLAYPGFVLSSVSHKSAINIQQSLFNQKNFSNDAYNFTDIDLNSELKWSGQGFKYFHNLGLTYQRGLDLDFFSPRVTELFVNKKNGSQSLSFGRKLQTWSEVDKVWKLGLTQPLFNLDFLSPQEQGLTGLHYSWRGNGFFLKSFVSYFHLPGQGPSYRLENEKLSSLNPWFSLPPNQVLERGILTDVRYQIREPDVNDVVFRGAGAIQLGYSNKKSWMNIGYANKINNSFHTSYLFSEETSGGPSILAVVDVQAKRHQLYTFDLGRRWEEVTAWLSFLKDKPEGSFVKPSEWVESDLSTQDWLSGGLRKNHFLVNDLNVSASYIRLFKNKKEKGTLIEYPELDDVFTRNYFNREESVQFSVDYTHRLSRRKKIVWEGRFEYSLPDQGQLSTTKIKYLNSRLQLFVEGGVISASKNNENTFYSKFKGNDFLRLGGSYVF